jgi:5-formyltetrahydrofolate cyclo-ligase
MLATTLEEYEQLLNHPPGYYLRCYGHHIPMPPFPPSDLDGESLDVCIVPGLAFGVKDEFRIGHGLGHYDRFLNGYCRRHGQLPLLIGICHREQLLTTDETDDLPESHDVSMNVVLAALIPEL